MRIATKHVVSSRENTSYARPVRSKTLSIVINTRHQSAGSKVCVDDLIPQLQAAGHTVMHNDWDDYKKYDLALFMSPDAEPQRAKQQNPAIKTGIMVPMTDYPKLQQNARAADFLLVGSLEARDEQLKYNPNIFIYYHFPRLPGKQKHHVAKEPTIIGYHGNKEHLINLHPHITAALDNVAKSHAIELWAIYNIEKYGQWSRHLPRQTLVKHIQWSPTIYEEKLAQCDIGIVNNAIPMSVGWRHLLSQPLARYTKIEIKTYKAHDTLIRFKYATNPGRIYPFAQLGIPVVADFTPSMNQVIRDGYSGRIAHSTAGWYHALKELIEQPALRQNYSDNLRDYIETNYSLEQNFTRLNEFLVKQVLAENGSV